MSDHIYPNLPYYKRAWVPVLEMAKLMLEEGEEYFLCTAVTEAAMKCETRYGGTWLEMGAKIRDAISDALGKYMTVIDWYRGTFSESISKQHKSQSERAKDLKAYRLGWLDHIIAECKDA